MLKTKKEIEQWLNRYYIYNFIINDDLTVDVNGDVNLFLKELTELSFQFGVINGNFNCSHNKLTSLENCPKEINGNFDCASNNLTSLKHCPEEVTGYFDCSSNNLTNFEYLPKKIGGDIDCSDNKAKKELLYLFNSNIEGDISNDFGDKEEFLKLVELFKNIKKEKEDLNKIITISDNNQLPHKRL